MVSYRILTILPPIFYQICASLVDIKNLALVLKVCIFCKMSQIQILIRKKATETEKLWKIHVILFAKSVGTLFDDLCHKRLSYYYKSHGRGHVYKVPGHQKLLPYFFW